MTRYQRRALFTAICCALVMCLMAGGAVSAHARLKISVPAANATVPAAPAQVVITFSEETSATKSGGSVADASGAAVSTGFKVDLNERTKMTIDLEPNLPGGVYTVKWNTFTDDDNGTADGTFTFTVQGGAQQAATAAPTTTAAVGSATTGSAPAGTRPATTAPTAAPTTAPTAAATATRAASAAAATGTGGATTLPATGNPGGGGASLWLLVVVAAGAAALIAGFAVRRTRRV